MKIESHDGFLDGSLNLRINHEQSKKNSWNFYRENTNHAYLSNGNVKYSKDCKNNLIISSIGEIELANVNNSFIFSNEKNVEIFSISDFKKIKRLGLESLFKKIKYNVPLRVKKRERLFNYGLDKIKDILESSYDVNALFISPIFSGRVKEGKYFIRDTNQKEYVFKYKGSNKKEVEISSKIFSNIGNYFPKNHKRIDASSYSIKLLDGFYGLEDFVKGNQINKRNLEYIKKIGKTMALIHNKFDSFLTNNPKLDFIEKGENFNESNLLSLYLDLSNKNSNSNFLIHFIEDIISQNLSSKMREIPKKIIHGDINTSNVVDVGKKLIIFDSETIGQDKRLKEFISPLLLDGNMVSPSYLSGSLPILISQYNKYSNDPLTQDEISLLPNLLQAALLKYYVVREIRRENKTKDGIEKTIEGLEKIIGDSNVY